MTSDSQALYGYGIGLIGRILRYSYRNEDEVGAKPDGWTYAEGASFVVRRLSWLVSRTNETLTITCIARLCRLNLALKHHDSIKQIELYAFVHVFPIRLGFSA